MAKETELEETKAQETATLQEALCLMQIQIDEANAKVIKEREAARKAIEEAPPVVKETPIIVQDTKKIDTLAAEVGSLKCSSTADYHTAARSIGGCAIYVRYQNNVLLFFFITILTQSQEAHKLIVITSISDKPGNHNFDLLKKLVLQDGSMLRAQLPGRPTLDCLFADPTRDGVSLLKIWNVNKCTGVVGVFNCQGDGRCKIEKKTRIHDASPGILTGFVQPTDVDALTQVHSQGRYKDALEKYMRASLAFKFLNFIGFCFWSSVYLVSLELTSFTLSGEK
ncbi:putative glycosyl hydrolase 36 [Helianthus annuus]|nr:putative glycosyl hydrolase 36 [Helianthus annuus]